MANVKKTLKKFGRYTWELFKASIPSAFMFFCAGTILMMLTLDEKKIEWTNSTLTWTIVCALGAAAYAALLGFGMGGSNYEMLVTGNIKRMSALEIDGGYKMSSHKEFKEYRPWKGFAIGGFTAIYTVIIGIVFGCNQARIDGGLNGGGLAVFVLVSFLISGWSILPLYILNASGVYVSYFVSCAFALLPILTLGGFYIWGAYARRNKAVRQQIIAEKAAEAEANKVKKINYGGLPGTKPKKRK